jgi:hypothetical protein
MGAMDAWLSRKTSEPTALAVDADAALRAPNARLEPVRLRVGTLTPLRVTRSGGTFRLEARYEAWPVAQDVVFEVEPHAVRVASGETLVDATVRVSTPSDGIVGAALGLLLDGGMLPTRRDGEFELEVLTPWDTRRLKDAGQRVTVRVTPASGIPEGTYEYEARGDEITLRA